MVIAIYKFLGIPAGMLFRNHTAGWHLPAIILREKPGISGRSGNLSPSYDANMHTCFRIYRLRDTAGWWLASSTFFNWAYATHPARSILNLVDISWNRSSLDSRFHNCYLHLPRTTVYCKITPWQWGWWLFLLMAMSGLATNFTISLDGWIGIYTPCFQVARCRWWTWNHGTDPKLQEKLFPVRWKFPYKHTEQSVKSNDLFLMGSFFWMKLTIIYWKKPHD